MQKEWGLTGVSDRAGCTRGFRVFGVCAQTGLSGSGVLGGDLEL